MTNQILDTVADKKRDQYWSQSLRVTVAPDATITFDEHSSAHLDDIVVLVMCESVSDVSEDPGAFTPGS